MMNRLLRIDKQRVYLFDSTCNESEYLYESLASLQLLLRCTLGFVDFHIHYLKV